MKRKISKELRAWYAEIGRRGGKKSRRVLTKEDQAKMQAGRVRKREERCLIDAVEWDFASGAPRPVMKRKRKRNG